MALQQDIQSQFQSDVALKYLSIEEIIQDFKICCISREMSLLGRREVLTGKAKFGIFGGGKEVPQVAKARAFRKGDYRSGYYRDQTFILALGLCTIEDLFAQLYADCENDPFSGGRQMNPHFATPFTNNNQEFLDLKNKYNISADISTTSGQMPRGLGLAMASKKFRSNPLLKNTDLSTNGNEVVFMMIGDASTSEGPFWETMNAASVNQVPIAISVWDDGYGISVPTSQQTVKGSISDALAGFKSKKKHEGLDIYSLKAWDYATLIEAYLKGIEKVRKLHKPALFHIKEVTQTQGHSTSGSHERYKTKERLAWEKEYDCIAKMREWMIDSGISTDEELDQIAKEAKKEVKEAKKRAWQAFSNPTKKSIRTVTRIYKQIHASSKYKNILSEAVTELSKALNPTMREVVENVKRVLRSLKNENTAAQHDLEAWLKSTDLKMTDAYFSHLYNEGKNSATLIPEIKPVFSDQSIVKNGYEVLNTFFDHKLATMPKFYAFGEDVGQIGGVNQAFSGLQEKHGKDRVFDTGIRENSIVGKGLGMAMRGLRPIAEIQYLDYLAYAFTVLTDDVATLHYRSNGIQKAPLIVRTRGHRLEGIWHSGSPMGMMIHAMRGICILVPRDMVQAAGMYNTMLKADDPAIIIECLNGYRLKEKMPDNLHEFTVPIGVPEVLKTGTDVTLVTYGSCVRVAQEGIEWLEKEGISVELIDVRSLLPFDINHIIGQSLQKTNRIIFMDEDVPGGATGFIMREVLEVQGGYKHLDSKPTTITAAPNRPPYGDVGDYYTKPNADTVFETVYKMMHEAEPNRFKKLYFLK